MSWRSASPVFLIAFAITWPPRDADSTDDCHDASSAVLRTLGAPHYRDVPGPRLDGGLRNRADAGAAGDRLRTRLRVGCAAPRGLPFGDQSRRAQQRLRVREGF